MTYSPIPYLGLGTTFQFGMSTIVQIAEYGGWEPEMGNVETTNMGSAQKTFLATLLDAGTVSFTIQYAPQATVHAALTTAFFAGTIDTCTITFNDGSTWAASCFLSKFAPNPQGPEDLLIAEVELKATGAITITPFSS
jgi:hypothetical protein